VTEDALTICHYICIFLDKGDEEAHKWLGTYPTYDPTLKEAVRKNVGKVTALLDALAAKHAGFKYLWSCRRMDTGMPMAAGVTFVVTKAVGEGLNEVIKHIQEIARQEAE
jgi:hypothetical protein